MTDCTVAAPVRATKAPARSKKTPSPDPIKPVQNEGDTLAIEAAQVLLGITFCALYNDENKPRELGNQPLERARELLDLLRYPDDHERHPLDPARGDIYGHLAHISSELEYALEDMLGATLPDYAPSDHAVFTALIECAYNFAERLLIAYSGLPATLEDLRALTTEAGAKPLRDRPQPAIRRVERKTALVEISKEPIEHLHDQLQIGATVASLLVHNFGGDGDCDTPSKAPGLQGMVLVLRDATRKAYALAIEQDIPQAPLISNAAALAEHMAMLSDAKLFSGDHGFRLGDGLLCDAFWSIEHLLEQVCNEVEV